MPDTTKRIMEDLARAGRIAWRRGEVAAIIRRHVEPLEEAFETAYKALFAATELNMSNYSVDEVSALNAAVNDVCCMMDDYYAATGKPKGADDAL